MVTVTSAQLTPPKSIFTMFQCSCNSDSVTIGCVARGFSPADSLSFKWTDNAKNAVSDFVQYPAFGSDGDYTKISHLRVNKTDWHPKKPYQCEASNSEGTKTSLVPQPPPPPAPSSCSVGLTPVVKELFLKDKVVLEAVVSIDINSVSCKVNNDMIPPSNISQSKNKYSVTVGKKRWFDGEKVTCNINNGKITQEISFNKGDEKNPTVNIYKPDPTGTGHVSHVCEVTGHKLGDVYIMWKLGESPYREGTTSAPMQLKDSTSVLSILSMTKKEYDDPSTTITCAVFHANMKNISSPLQVPTSKSKPPEPVDGFTLDCNADVFDEDEFRSLWSTATSFIFLFLFSLTYCAVLSFFKVKQ